MREPIEAISDQIRRCELFGLPEDAARLRLREFLPKREAHEAAAFHGKSYPTTVGGSRAPAESRRASGDVDFDVFISCSHQDKGLSTAAR